MKTLLATIALSVAVPSLLASADLSLKFVTPPPAIRAGFPYGATITIQNAGPDSAKNVVVTTTTSTLSLASISSGQQFFMTFIVTGPATAGSITISASIASDTFDPNLSDNSASETLPVSADPDLTVSMGVPPRLDLSLPFSLQIYVGNQSKSDAHDVDLTIDFRPDVTVQSLPAACSSVAAGRIVCHAGMVPAQTTEQPALFTARLYAPPAYGTGSMPFTISAMERENDFNPASNTKSLEALLYNTFYVATTADSGTGSLRQAILDANADTQCPTAPCAIAFRIPEESTTPWKTIRITSPLPRITALGLRIDGGTQAGFFGDANLDGPEIEISGGGTVDGDGLLIAACFNQVANLAIGGFLRNGISVTGSQLGCTAVFPPGPWQLDHLFIGTDPTGASAHPNARGIGTSVVNSNSIYERVGAPTNIHDCVISGNTFSGIFGMSGRLNISNNRIGVKAHADEPLPNGASGVFVGAGGFGSDVGPDAITGRDSPTIGGNVIAFNGETGVAIATGVIDVGVRNNRIWGNRLLGIDIGLDGPTMSSVTDYEDLLSVPVLTLAHYDPAANKTILEGDIPAPKNGFHDEFGFLISFFASDAADPSGFGEGQRPIGFTPAVPPLAHFRFEAAGDLTGQWITATSTHASFGIAAKPEGIDQGFLTQTSEFSRGVPAN